MITTLAAIDPSTRRRGLLAEIHPEIVGKPPESIIKDFCERLFLRNIRVGLLVTPMVTLVVRDRLRSMRFSRSEYDVVTLETQSLLDVAELGTASKDEGLGKQIHKYLAAVAASWSSFVPSDAIPAMIPEVVGELAQVDFEVWNGVLEESDAR